MSFSYGKVLVNFLNNLNTRHVSIRLEFQYSKVKMELLDILL